MAYASTAQVETTTGVTVTTAEISRAQTIIEMRSNRTEAASGDFSERDLYWLRLATAYQTAWMKEHPEVFTVQDAASVSQQDLSVTPKDSESWYLAPLAKKALRNVSWMRTRSISLSSDFIPARTRQTTEDEHLDWVPMNP